MSHLCSSLKQKYYVPMQQFQPKTQNQITCLICTEKHAAPESDTMQHEALRKPSFQGKPGSQRSFLGLLVSVRIFTPDTLNPQHQQKPPKCSCGLKRNHILSIIPPKQCTSDFRNQSGLLFLSFIHSISPCV